MREDERRRLRACAATPSTRRRSTTCASSSASRSRPASAAATEIEDAINRVYERHAGEEQLESDDASAEDEAASDILDSDEEAPIIRWVNSLFLQAMKERASDIHIEPEEKEVIVRYRIDGELYVARRAPRAPS